MDQIPCIPPEQRIGSTPILSWLCELPSCHVSYVPSGSCAAPSPSCSGMKSGGEKQSFCLRGTRGTAAGSSPWALEQPLDAKTDTGDFYGEGKEAMNPKPWWHTTTNIHGIPGVLEIFVNHLQEKRSNGTLINEIMRICRSVWVSCWHAMKAEEGHTVCYVYLCSVNLCLFSYNVISLEGLYKYRESE